MRGWRIVPLLLSLGAFAANAVILLSDRAPGLFRRLSARIDAGVPGADVGVARSDFDVHVVIWAVAALLVGLAAWSWLSLFLGSTVVFAWSVALELAQRRFTNSRTVQFDDLVANAAGVACGTGAVALFALAWWVVSRGSRRSGSC